MKLRVKAWYAKELELDGEIARSTMPVHAPDGHGGFYMLSANSRRSGRLIENVLNGHQDHICNATCFSLFLDVGMVYILGALESPNGGAQKCIGK